MWFRTEENELFNLSLAHRIIIESIHIKRSESSITVWYLTASFSNKDIRLDTFYSEEDAQAAINSLAERFYLGVTMFHQKLLLKKTPEPN